MRTFRLIGMALLAIVICVSFASCGGSDDKEEPVVPPKSPIENFNQADMNFTEKAGEQVFSFTANAAWTVSVASTSGGSTWCTASPANGEAGNQTVKITVTENDTYDDRSVTVTLKAGNESKSFVVTQKQKNAILLTSDKFEIEQKGSTFTVEVKANVNYTATIGETCKDWITEGSGTRALSTTTKTYSVAANEDSEKRKGTITFTDGTLSETVHVYQAGGDIILLSKNECNVDAAGEDITVELKSNCEYEVEMPKVDWIHEVSTRALSSHTLHYTINANATYDTREAKIIYRNKKNDVAETLTIVQAQKDAIILGKKEMTVKAEGETIEVKLSVNVDYEVEMPDVDWIHEVSTRAMSEHTLYYTIDANSTYDNRETKISYRNKEKDIVETLTITQEQKDAIILGEKEIAVKAKGETIEVKLSANVDYEVEMPKVDWIHETSTRALFNHTLHYTIDANSTYDSREARIIYRNNKNDVTETLTIIQAQKDAIILGKKEVTVKANGETIEVKLFANVDYEVEMPKVDWITTADTRSLTEHTLHYKVAKNESDDSRFAKIKFKNKEKRIEDVLTVTQEGTIITLHIANAGDLPDMIEHKHFNALKLTGYLNGTDIKVIRGMTGPAYLDISEANIVEGGERYWRGYEYFYVKNNVIGDYMFYDKTGMKEILLPNSVTTIGKAAFSGCWGLTSITIPNSVTTIESNAFAYCRGFASIEIPNSVTTIESAAFQFCTDLTNITIPNSITTIESSVFANCGLTSITIPNSVTIIGNSAFGSCYRLTNITIPNSVTTIKYDAFAGCESLTNITIPNSVTKIESGTFSGCRSLTNVEIPNSVTAIGISAFNGCRSFKNIEIPNSVTAIERATFQFCSSLTNITIPNNVTTIGSSAFKDCCKLDTIHIGKNVERIEQHAFWGVSANEVHCLGTIPPKIMGLTSRQFDEIDEKTAKLYVPKGTYQAYHLSDWGIIFKNIIEMEE